MAHVFSFRTWQSKEVKNLGWLLRHASEASCATIFRNGLNGNEASLVVEGPGWTFYSPFASADVARQWVRRRALEHISVTESPRFYGLTNLKAGGGVEL